MTCRTRSIATTLLVLVTLLCACASPPPPGGITTLDGSPSGVAGFASSPGRSWVSGISRQAA